MCSFFSFFTIKLFTLDSIAVRITCEFHLYYLYHVCKVNKWCLVDCFHHKLSVFFLHKLLMALWQVFTNCEHCYDCAHNVQTNSITRAQKFLHGID